MFSLLMLLLLKHYLLDFVFQTPYMFKNKGTFGHMGGVLHSGLHASVTFIILYFSSYMSVAIYCSLAEFVIHYFTDFAKVRLEKKYELNSSNPKYWQLFGLDQLIHNLTYVLITLSAVAVYIGDNS